MSLSPAAATAAAAAGAATCCACAAARLAASSRRDDAGAKRSTNHDADLRDDGEHAFSFIDYQPERYGELLEERSVRVTRRFRELGLLRENVECEIHPSAPTHYRLRVGFGVYDPSRPDTWRLACSTSGDRLRYVYWDAGEMVPVANDTFPIASVTICRAMPLVLDWLSKEPALRAGIRATKFLSTLDGQLLVTLIYKGRGLGTKGWEPLDDQRPEPADDTWPQYAKAMQTALSAAQPDTVCVGVIGRSKNVRVVVGDSHVIETGIVLRDGRKLVYKQPEQAFSNPNGGMAIHTLNWLSSCAETIRSHAAVCKAITTPPVSHQAASKRVERSSASQARKARTVLVLLLDAQGECLLRRRTARKGGVEWDVFGAAVQEGQTLSEAAFCELFAALPQLAEAAVVDSFRVPNCKAEAFVFQLQASDGIAAGLLDASEDLAWVSVAAAQEQASWRLRQTVSRSDFDRCLPAAAVDAQQISEVQESDDGEAQARGIELLELYCGNGNHTVAMSGVFNRVLAVEINPKLVAAGKENMKLNGVENVECLCVNAQYFSRNMLGSQTWRAQGGGHRYRFNAVLVDPPRAGLDTFTCSKVANYTYIMYISCNPEALERDLQQLAHTHTLRRFAFFDHFPYTKHVECGALLVRRDAMEEVA